MGHTTYFVASSRAFANYQKTLLQGYSSMLRIPNARGVFQEERRTTPGTKETTSVHKGSVFLGYETLSQEIRMGTIFTRLPMAMVVG